MQIFLIQPEAGARPLICDPSEPLNLKLDSRSDRTLVRERSKVQSPIFPAGRFVALVPEVTEHHASTLIGRQPDPFLTLGPQRSVEAAGGAAMDDLTSQERALIMTFRRLRSFTVVVHRNDRWRIVLADEEAGTTNTGEGEDFGKAWEEVGRKR